MEVESSAMLAAEIQRKSKDRQIFVTSVRDAKMYSSRKSSANTIHLLSHMAEFNEDEPPSRQIEAVDLDQFELAKQTVQSYILQLSKPIFRLPEQPLQSKDLPDNSIQFQKQA